MPNYNWRDPESLKIRHNPEKDGGKIYFDSTRPAKKKKKHSRKLIKALILLGILAVLMAGIIAVATFISLDRDAISSSHFLYNFFQFFVVVSIFFVFALMNKI